LNINKILTLMVSLTLFLVIFSTVLNLVPWYRQKEPMQVIPNGHSHKPFQPGEPMAIKIERVALIGFEGRVTRELVKVHPDGAEEEVYKIDNLISIDKGEKSVVVYYRIPTIKECPQVSGNTYMWRGAMVYRPLGFLEKTYFFRTEEFQLKVPNHPAQHTHDIK